jgi:very-short-patch-repair endonuclease
MRGGRIVTNRARALRRLPTDAERRLWYFLRRNHLGFRFRRQFPLPPYFVDFACIEARLIVEADGGQHAVPGEHERRDAFLTSKGWRILRFWNNDILQNQDGVFRIIIETLKNMPTPERSKKAIPSLGRPPPHPSPVSTGEGEPRSGREGAGTSPSTLGDKEHLSAVRGSGP